MIVIRRHDGHYLGKDKFGHWQWASDIASAKKFENKDEAFKAWEEAGRQALGFARLEEI